MLISRTAYILKQHVLNLKTIKFKAQLSIELQAKSKCVFHHNSR